MSKKKSIAFSEVLPEPSPMGTDKDTRLLVSRSPELVEFERLLARYKAKMLEQQAHLFRS